MAIEPVPTPSVGDGVHAWAKAGLSVLPAASDLFQMLVQPPLEKRKQKWMSDVGSRLAALERETAGALDSLQENDVFISAVMHASAVAIRNHQEEKLEALKNAVLNVAKGQAPDDALLHMFFQFVDDLSVLQVQILEVMRSPKVPPNLISGGLDTVLEYSMPQLRGKSAIYSRLWNDLAAKGLLDGTMHATMSSSGLAARRTTALAEAFLKFISP